MQEGVVCFLGFLELVGGAEVVVFPVVVVVEVEEVFGEEFRAELHGVIEVDAAIGVEAGGEDGIGMDVDAGGEVVVHMGDDLVCEFGVFFLEPLEEEAEHLHTLVDGAAVAELADCECQAVDGAGLLEADGRTADVSEAPTSKLHDKHVTMLGDLGREGCGGAFKALPVALFDPDVQGAAADVENGCDLGFGETGLKEEVFGPLVFFVLQLGVIVL